MQRILNFGSLNIDHVYQVKEFVRPGETISSQSYARFSGGKGLNQSIALAQAGAQVWHVGKVGADGTWLVEQCRQKGVHTHLVSISDVPTGHAMIQVNQQGENCIVLYAGANHQMQEQDLDHALQDFTASDAILMQNETNLVAEMIHKAREKGLLVCFNPAPMTEQVRDYPLHEVDILILNSIEAEVLSGAEKSEHAGAWLRDHYPHTEVIITLGKDGAQCWSTEGFYSCRAEKVQVVDTTAAGDTFVGYYLANRARTTPQECLSLASRAAGLCVQKPGAADSIPSHADLS